MIEGAADIHILAPFCVDLTCFLSDDPTASFVFLFKHADKDCGKLDFVFTIVFPFCKVFLILIVLGFNLMICFYSSLFSLNEIFHHFLMMLERLILETHFVQSLSLVGSDIIKALLEQILVISYGFHIFLAPGIEFLDNVIWIGCDFFLFLEHPHFVRIWLPKASIVIWKSSF